MFDDSTLYWAISIISALIGFIVLIDSIKNYGDTEYGVSFLLAALSISTSTIIATQTDDEFLTKANAVFVAIAIINSIRVNYFRK